MSLLYARGRSTNLRGRSSGRHGLGWRTCRGHGPKHHRPRWDTRGFRANGPRLMYGEVVHLPCRIKEPESIGSTKLHLAVVHGGHGARKWQIMYLTVHAAPHPWKNESSNSSRRHCICTTWTRAKTGRGGQVCVCDLRRPICCVHKRPPAVTGDVDGPVRHFGKSPEWTTTFDGEQTISLLSPMPCRAYCFL